MFETDQSWTRQRSHRWRVSEILETIHKQMEGTSKSLRRVHKRSWKNIPYSYTRLKSKCHHDGNEKGQEGEVKKRCQVSG